MTTNPPVEPRKVVPLQDCKRCYGSGMELVSVALLANGCGPTFAPCDCVLEQLTNDNQPFTIDTTPNDLTRGVEVKEG